MPYIARVVAFVDALGYLRCVACANGDAARMHAVHADAAPHNAERCDCCGSPVANATPAEGR